VTVKTEEWPWEEEYTTRRTNTEEWPWFSQNDYSFGQSNKLQWKSQKTTHSSDIENWPWEGMGVKSYVKPKAEDNRTKWKDTQRSFIRRTSGFLKSSVMEGKDRG
jgi:hypothetical protein